jgi:hypothetical protein
MHRGHGKSAWLARPHSKEIFARLLSNDLGREEAHSESAPIKSPEGGIAFFTKSIYFIDKLQGFYTMDHGETKSIPLVVDHDSGIPKTDHGAWTTNQGAGTHWPSATVSSRNSQGGYDLFCNRHPAVSRGIANHRSSIWCQSRGINLFGRSLPQRPALPSR